MNNSQKEIFAIRFADCMARLKLLGLKGDICVNASSVVISTSDSVSAKGFRKALKTACARTDSTWCETRPNKGSYVFAVAV